MVEGYEVEWERLSYTGTVNTGESNCIDKFRQKKKEKKEM